jgi:hypothetical protein
MISFIYSVAVLRELPEPRKRERRADKTGREREGDRAGEREREERRERGVV